MKKIALIAIAAATVFGSVPVTNTYATTSSMEPVEVAPICKKSDGGLELVKWQFNNKNSRTVSVIALNTDTNQKREFDIVAGPSTQFTSIDMKVANNTTKFTFLADGTSFGEVQTNAATDVYCDGHEQSNDTTETTSPNPGTETSPVPTTQTPPANNGSTQLSYDPIVQLDPRCVDGISRAYWQITKNDNPDSVVIEYTNVDTNQTESFVLPPNTKDAYFTTPYNPNFPNNRTQFTISYPNGTRINDLPSRNPNQGTLCDESILIPEEPGQGGGGHEEEPTTPVTPTPTTPTPGQGGGSAAPMAEAAPAQTTNQNVPSELPSTGAKEDLQSLIMTTLLISAAAYSATYIYQKRFLQS